MESISVVLPVKNGEPFLGRLIPQILQNISEVDEILVINDHSNDKTLDILESFAANNSSIRILNADKSGLVEALNLGVRSAANNWIARFDVDDNYPVNRLSVQRECINESIGVIFSDYQVQSVLGDNLGVIPSAITSSGTLLSLISSNRTAHPSALFNRNKFLAAGGYLEEEFPAEDLGLWFRMARQGDLITVPTVLLEYTLHSESVSSTRRVQMQNARKMILRKYAFSVSQLNFINQDIDRTIGLYSRDPSGTFRTLLFTLDYLLLRKIGLVPQNFYRNLLKLLWQLFKFPNTGSVLFDGIRMRRMRNKIRNKS